MYLPRPIFGNDASAAEIKRYLVTLVEAIEKEMMKQEESNGELE